MNPKVLKGLKLKELKDSSKKMAEKITLFFLEKRKLVFQKKNQKDPKYGISGKRNMKRK